MNQKPNIGDTHKTFLVENAVNLHNLEFGNTLLEMTPKTWTKKKNILELCLKNFLYIKHYLKMNRAAYKMGEILHIAYLVKA